MSQSTSQPTSSPYYFAIYELHEIPWKISEPISLISQPNMVHFKISQGPITVPNAASPTVTTKAGGFSVSTKHELLELEGHTFLEVAIAIDDIDWPVQRTMPKEEWNELRMFSDDAAATVGLCLNQRRPLQKVAEYAGENDQDGVPIRLEFHWQFSGGAKASVSKRSSGSISRALISSLNERVSPQTLTALRWYEQSKAANVGADRLVSLWIALEALMGRGSHPTIVRRTAEYLTKKEFKLGLDADTIKTALGLDKILQARNAIIHEGERVIAWPLSDDPKKRDWPQILDDVVGEILRYRFRATLQRTLGKHVQQGLELAGDQD